MTKRLIIKQLSEKELVKQYGGFTAFGPIYTVASETASSIDDIIIKGPFYTIAYGLDCDGVTLGIGYLEAMEMVRKLIGPIPMTLSRGGWMNGNDLWLEPSITLFTDDYRHAKEVANMFRQQSIMYVTPSGQVQFM